MAYNSESHIPDTCEAVAILLIPTAKPVPQGVRLPSLFFWQIGRMTFAIAGLSNWVTLLKGVRSRCSAAIEERITRRTAVA